MSEDRTGSGEKRGNAPTERGHPARLALVGGLFAFALSLATHYEVLTYWFTGPDTLTLVETSRIQGYESAMDTLSAPLMHGTNFVTLTGKFYRPVASLSYAIDYWVWGLDPFGYHLTDLLLHASAAALVVSLVAEQIGFERGRSGQRRERRRHGRLVGLIVATLAGGLFALHPLTAEVVPVSARRHDVLATIFVLASLWALTRGLRAPWPGRRLRYLALSLCAYALALGSKEIGVLLPALAVSWTALDAYGRSGEIVKTIRETVLVGVGYAVVSASYLGLRVSLLGGIGGYVGPFGGVKDTPVPVIVSQYFLSLFYPVDVLGFGNVEYVPATIYVVLAVGGGLALAGIVGAGGVRPFVRGRGRLGVFYAIWLCLPLPLIIRVGEYSPWTGYIALVPVAALCALVVTTTASATYRWSRQVAGTAGIAGIGTLRAGLGVGGSLATLALAAFLVLSLVSVSPLVHPYNGWKQAGDVSEAALTGAEGRIERLPPDAVVKVEGLPTVTTLGPPTTEPRVKSLRYFWAHSVRSWVHLRDPGSRMSTFTHGITTPVGSGSVEVVVGMEPRPNGPSVLRFRYESRASANRADGIAGENGRSTNASLVTAPSGSR